MNYLSDARRLPEVLSTTRWPIGYLAFLYLLLPILGPYYIFLSNLPLLAGIAVLVARLAQPAAEEHLSRAQAPFAGVIALAFVLAYQPQLLLQMANPYRDPLSHLLLLASALALIEFLRRQSTRVGLIIASGLLAGLSYSVREPAVLATPFFALATLCYGRRHGLRIPLWKLGVLFAAAFALGSVPYLLQTYLRTRQFLVPAEAAVAGRIPGMHLGGFRETFSKALGRFVGQATPPALFFLLLAALSAICRRSVLTLALILPAFVTYFLFYSFYWTYVPRYFFTAVLLAAPLVGAGACVAARALSRIPGLARLDTPVVAFLASASCVFAGWRMATAPAWGPRFLLSHARRLSASVNHAIAPGSLLLAPRNLCEVASWFTHAESFPLSAFLCEPDRHPDEAARAHVDERIAKGQEVYIVAHVGPGQRDLDYEAAARLFSLKRSFALGTEDYPLSPAGTDGELQVYSVEAWSRTRSTCQLDGFEEPEAILRVDAGPLRRGWPPRESTRLLLNGKPLDDALRDGANYYLIRRSESPPPYRLILESDRPVSDSLAASFLFSREPIVLDFDVRADPSHAGFLTAGFLPATPLRPGPVLLREGCLELPFLWPGADVVFAELGVCGTRLDPNTTIRLEMEADDLAPVSATVPKDRVFHAVAVALPSPRAGAVIPLRLRAEDLAPASGRPPAGLEFDHARIEPVFLASERAIDVGTSGDEPFIQSGFYRREQMPSSETTFRWTTSGAEVRLFLRAPRSDLLLSLRCCSKFRPANAPAAMALQFNHEPVPLTAISEPDDEGWTTFSARVPASLLHPTGNAVQILCNGWAPPTADQRVLGVMIDRIELRPLPPDTPPASQHEAQSPAASPT